MDLDKAIARIEQQTPEQEQLALMSLPPIQDSDIEKMILNSQERDFKARIWTNLNKQWLIE